MGEREGEPKRPYYGVREAAASALRNIAKIDRIARLAHPCDLLFDRTAAAGP